jgi:hypothetical protein
MNRPKISNSLIHLLTLFVTIFCLSSWASAHSITVDPGSYAGKWYINGDESSFEYTGSANIDLVTGTHNIQVDTYGTFEIYINDNGMVTVNNGIYAVGSQNRLTFNTTELNVNPNGYQGYLKIGLGTVLGTPDGFENETLSANLVPGFDYIFSVAYHSDFLIHIDEFGNVTSDNPAAAICSGNTLTLKTTLLNVKPNGYVGKLKVANGPDFGWSAGDPDEVLSELIVPGLAYQFDIALYSNFRFHISADGKVISDNPTAATTSEDTITFNTIKLNVDNEGNSVNWFIHNGPGGDILGPKSGSDSVLIVPVEKYYLNAGGVQKFIYPQSNCSVTPSTISGSGFTLNLSIACAPQYYCSGFESPMDQGPVTVKKSKALPLKAHLFDENGYAIADADIVAPPVLQVIYNPAAEGDPEDVTDYALSAGEGTDGNQFVFIDEGKWQFNLKTKNYVAPGTYNITITSGDASEYEIVSSCIASFIIK